MAKQFNVPFDVTEEQLLESLKNKLRMDGISQKEWLKSKILEDIEVKSDDNASKITDFHDKYVKATPPFYAKRIVWLQHLGVVSQDEEAIKEFESRMRMLTADWNHVWGMRDNIERLKRFVENPKSVMFL